MECLKNLGISLETINYLKDSCIEEELESIEHCIDRIESSILYLREIGVKNSVIEEILRIDFHVLMPGRKYLEKSLYKLKSVDDFVKAINEHVEYMDYLMNIS